MIKRMKKPEYPERKERVLVDSRIANSDTDNNFQSIIEHFDSLGIKPKNIDIEFSADYCWDCGGALEINICGYRKETDEEYEKRIVQYNEKMEVYKKWLEDNEEDLKKEKAEKKEKESQKIEQKRKQLLKELEQLDKLSKKKENKRNK